MPGAYIFWRAFLRGLFLEGLIFGARGLSLGGNCVSKLIGQLYSWNKIYPFCFLLLCIWGQFPSTSPPKGEGGGLIFRGAIIGVIYYGIIFIIDAGHHKICFLSFSSHLLVHCICHHQWFYWTTIQTLQKQMEVSVNSWIFSLVLLHWHCFALQFLPMDVIDLDCKCNL